jgi:DNA polymerase-1
MSAAPFKTWDCETTIHTSFKRKANPFDQRNWVVTHGIKGKGEAPIEYRFGSQRPGPGWLRPVLAGTKLLVGMNLKFDLLHALQDAENLDAWMDYIVGGGQIFDIQLAEYLLNGMTQKDQMLSLDELAPRYGGNVKVDEVKALWEAGVPTEQIEPALLSRYLIGGADEHGVVHQGDLGNTELVALAQIQRARNVGQLNSLMLNMGSLVASIEMERNGVFVDKARGLELAAEMQLAITALRDGLEGYLPADLPFAFNWKSRFHKSALIFGGTVMYEGLEYQLKDGTWVPEAGHPEQAYAQKDVVAVTVAALWSNVSSQVGPGDLIPMEQARELGIPVERYAGGKNAGEVKTKKVKADDLGKPKQRRTKYPFTFAGFTKPEKKWETSDPGFYKTGAEVIEELGVRDIPFLKALSQFSGMVKDLGTYYIVTDEETGEQKGMLTLVDTFGIVHHKINHTSTVTTRFSSSDPNLQNVPKEGKSVVKSIFVSRFKGGKIIQSDFTSLEIFVQAILTQCGQLIADLRAGLDMHVNRVAATHGITYEAALAKCKGPTAEPVWEKKRTEAKVFSFQRAYGAGAKKISDTTGMSMDDVEALIVAEGLRYPEIEEFQKALDHEVRSNRKPGSTFVPHPDLPGVMCQLGRGSYRTPDGQLFMFVESPAPEYLVKRGVTASFNPTEQKNYPMQGTGATWMKAGMWLLVREFYRRRNWGGRALLVNTVHDAAYADAMGEVANEVAAVVHACMEAASELMEFTFNWLIPVAVPSETTMGDSMMHEDKLPNVKAEAAPIRAELRRLYMKDYQPSFERN